MATCPRCYGPLNDHHKCRPRWVRRVIRQTLITFVGALVGILVSVVVFPHELPILAVVVGGTLGYGFAVVSRPE
jgi:uncharacterized membrane protein YccC